MCCCVISVLLAVVYVTRNKYLAQSNNCYSMISVCGGRRYAVLNFRMCASDFDWIKLKFSKLSQCQHSIAIVLQVALHKSGSCIPEYKCNGMYRPACPNMLIWLFALQVKDNKLVRPKSAMLPEKDYSLSELLNQVDSGISRSFDRVKEDSCHSKENTCKRLSGISSADSAFSSQDSITLSFEKENTCGKS